MKRLLGFFFVLWAMPVCAISDQAHLRVNCEVTTPDGITSKFHSQNLYLQKNKSVVVHQIRFELEEVYRAYFKAEWMGDDVAATIHIKNEGETKFSKTSARLVEQQFVEIDVLIEPKTWAKCAMRFKD